MLPTTPQLEPHEVRQWMREANAVPIDRKGEHSPNAANRIGWLGNDGKFLTNGDIHGVCGPELQPAPTEEIPAWRRRHHYALADLKAAETEFLRLKAIALGQQAGNINWRPCYGPQSNNAEHDLHVLHKYVLAARQRRNDIEAEMPESLRQERAREKAREEAVTIAESQRRQEEYERRRRIESLNI